MIPHIVFSPGEIDREIDSVETPPRVSETGDLRYIGLPQGYLPIFLQHTHSQRRPHPLPVRHRDHQLYPAPCPSCSYPLHRWSRISLYTSRDPQKNRWLPCCPASPQHMGKKKLSGSCCSFSLNPELSFFSLRSPSAVKRSNPLLHAVVKQQF